jgi:recA bacterial DNA recombination protein
MSSLQVLTPAAASRHFDFAFPRERVARLDLEFPDAPKLAGVMPASRLEVRAAPEMVSSGIPEIDSLTGGLPRGCLTEICGPVSSGRTSLLLAAMAAATRREEVCALVDASDALHPQSAAAAGMDLQKMLWVRCSSVKRTASQEDRGFNHADSPSSTNAFSKTWIHEEHKNHRSEFFALENSLRVTDLLLQSSGFGMVVIDLGDISSRAARRVPLTSWFRFRRAVENTNTVLLVSSRQPCAQTCASLLLQMGVQVADFRRQASGRVLSAPSLQSSATNIETERVPAHAQILESCNIKAELLRSRLERKPARSVSIGFETKAEWGS